jgi:hypothetical protein
MSENDIISKLENLVKDEDIYKSLFTILSNKDGFHYRKYLIKFINDNAVKSYVDNDPYFLEFCVALKSQANIDSAVTNVVDASNTNINLRKILETIVKIKDVK